MNILINASNIIVGGGVQVADSIIREIKYHKEHNFVIVYSDILSVPVDCVRYDRNVLLAVQYNSSKSLLRYLFRKNTFLDDIVSENAIDAVLTIFGPSKWKPKCKIHLCGFARAQIVLLDSPYWSILPIYKQILAFAKRCFLTIVFQRSSNLFYTENEYITTLLKNKFFKASVYTVTNTFNQVFDEEVLWKKDIVLPYFDGVTILTISANYPHKNLRIFKDVAYVLKTQYPSLKFRFVLTLDIDQYGELDEFIKDHFVFVGKINILQCPFLYQQCDIMCLPTLLECFSASYAESMKMSVPIVTTDLGFAHSICGDAAIYFNPVDARDLADKIYILSKDISLRQNLVKKGQIQLKSFDSSKSRVNKLLKILEKEYNNLN